MDAVLRKDLLKDRKSVHVKVSKELYVALRIWSFQKGVTIQEVFEEFARCLTEGDKKANGLVDSYILRNLGLPKPSNRVKSGKIVELSDDDKGSLYDLISGEEQGIGLDDQDVNKTL